MHELSAVLTLAYRDVMKFVRDRERLIATFIFPLMFIWILGGSMAQNLPSLRYSYIELTFVGVLIQTLFQSTALGIISLLEDRENDFSQEIFISPISRYTIIFGKITGETLVSLIQGLAIVFFGLVVGVKLTVGIALALLPICFLSCMLGGAFGTLVVSLFSTQRSINQIFPLIMFPQFFLAGIFNPIKNLDLPLDILSHLSPLRYAADFSEDTMMLLQHHLL
jgi:ABC-2 type transport system permease protein